MTSSKETAKKLLAATLGLALLLTAAQVFAIEVGVGSSELTEAKAAGVEAASAAKKALGDQTPKIVLVYNGDAVSAEHVKMLEGVASVFDASIVYGCAGYAPLTDVSNEGQVGVLALGGDITVTTAVAKTAGKDDDLACGARIGEALKEAAAAATDGKVLLLFGDCHVPRDDTVTKGVCGVLGENFPIIGGSAKGGRVYVKSEAASGINLGILIAGDFTCGFSLQKDMSEQGLVDSATTAFTEAVGDSKKTKLMLVFDCGGRRGAMLKNGNYPEELKAMKAVVGNVPIFGFYGSGEIGCKATGEAPCGVGYHISACAIQGK